MSLDDLTAEIQRDLITEIKTDPYAHMILTHSANAWADGYDQALRDVVELLARTEEIEYAHGIFFTVGASEGLRAVAKMWNEKTHGDLVADAMKSIVRESRQASAQALVALAQLGPLAMKSRVDG